MLKAGTPVNFIVGDAFLTGVYARPALRSGFHVVRNYDGSQSWVVHEKNIRIRTGGALS